MRPERARRLVRRILRVNHAGEHGAVAIYSAQLAQLPDSRRELKEWLAETLIHERNHRDAFRAAMPPRATKPCRTLWVWSLGGAWLGRSTALLGPSAVMACTAAVERTVHGHLVEQARVLDRIDPEFAALVRSIQIEEDTHLAYAEARHDRATRFARLISFVVSVATEAMIALSTRGDSLWLTRAD